VWIDALPVGDDAEWHAMLMRESVTVPGPACDRLAAAARRAGVVLVAGVNEREEYSGTVFNTVLTFGPDGELLGRHRKLIPTHAERLVWGRGDGSDLNVLDTPAGRLASLICLENYMPLARFHLYAQGREVWLAPTLGYRRFLGGEHAPYRSRGGYFVLGVAPVMHPDWLPESIPDATLLREDAARLGGWIFEGYSVIAAPTGELLAGPLVRERGILIADLDLGSLRPESGYLTRPVITTALTYSG
jgi:nitrilase